MNAHTLSVAIVVVAAAATAAVVVWNNSVKSFNGNQWYRKNISGSVFLVHWIFIFFFENSELLGRDKRSIFLSIHQCHKSQGGTVKPTC